MIKFKNQKKTAALITFVTLGGMYLVFFHTTAGLFLQYSASRRIECAVYTRFLASKLMVNRDVRLRKLAAELFMSLAGQDIYDARETWSSVIAEQPDARSYSARAYTYMYQRHYTNAVADYEMAIKLRDPRDVTGNVRGVHGLSNDLEIATVCAQTQSNQTASTVQ